MRIRKLELAGFKSFRDRTTTRFGDGITGIVGPNGCGKSNVVDALFWVMGDQSAKHLRGSVMEDVIFNGSETQSPTSMAEVTVTFDNDGSMPGLPPELSRFEQIGVCRRLFRDGTSEYFINRVPCRLRDVQELFMGTGVGGHGYSIIEQGRISEIISAKPQDRRAIIEEVAGITRYKVRKRAAERKMDQTRQNLLRVNDIVTELEKRLGSLKRQARRAERYVAFREEARTLELRFAAFKHRDLAARHSAVRERLTTLADTEAKLEAEVAGKEARIEELRLELVEAEEKLSKTQQRLHELDKRIEGGEQDLSFCQRTSEELTERKQEGSSEVGQLRKRLEELEVEQTELKAALEKAGAELAEDRGHLQKEESARQALATQIHERVRATEARKEEIVSCVGIESNQKARIENLALRRLDLRDRETRLRAELEEVAARRSELAERKAQQERDIGRLEAREQELLERIQVATESLERLRGEHRATEARLTQFRDELADRRSRLGSLLELQRSYEGFGEGVRRIMAGIVDAGAEGEDAAPLDDRGTKIRDGVLALAADFIEAPKRCERAVEALLGERLQSVVVRDAQTGAEAIALLGDEKAGRASFLPIEPRVAELPELPASLAKDGAVQGRLADLVKSRGEGAEGGAGVLRALLGDSLLVEDMSSALRIHAEGSWEGTLVTLAGEVIERSGLQSGGAAGEGAAQSILERKREIKELETAIQSMDTELKLARGKQLELEARIAGTAQTLDENREARHRAALELVDARKELARLGDEEERQLTRRDGLEGELQKLAEQHGTLDNEEAEAKDKLAEVVARQEALRTELSEMAEQEGQLREAMEQAAARTTELKVKVAAAQERRGSIEASVQRVRLTREETELRLRRTLDSIENAGDRVKELQERMDQTRQRLRELLDEVKEVKAGQATELSAHEDKKRALGEVEEALKSQRQLLEDTRRTRGECSLEEREIGLEITHLKENLVEKYDTDPATVAAELTEEDTPPTPEQEQRIAYLRRALDSISDVNFGAIEEFKEVGARHEFLEKQREDLEASLDALRRVIAKINRTSKQRFAEAYEAINIKFQDVYPRLFNGGRARLELTDAADLLESGVEIIAQPPGKKLGSIELMSGGEKALTAVSLVFAIFLIKPTPFCLLDEVDAPLDDANVGRFCDMVKQMSSHSQFLIITHNKATMEVAQQLYGVTMEEDGVSKMLNVKLEDIDDSGHAAA